MSLPSTPPSGPSFCPPLRCVAVRAELADQPLLQTLPEVDDMLDIDVLTVGTDQPTVRGGDEHGAAFVDLVMRFFLFLRSLWRRSIHGVPRLAVAPHLCCVVATHAHALMLFHGVRFVRTTYRIMVRSVVVVRARRGWSMCTHDPHLTFFEAVHPLALRATVCLCVCVRFPPCAQCAHLFQVTVNRICWKVGALAQTPACSTTTW